MSRDTQQFEALMREHILRLKEEKLEAIMSDLPIDAYRHWTGYIQCLKDMMKITHDVRKAVDQD